MYEQKIPRPILPSAFSLALFPESFLGDLGVEHSRFMVVAGIRHYQKLPSEKRGLNIYRRKNERQEKWIHSGFFPFYFRANLYNREQQSPLL